jgi:hypothetical protein
MLRGALKQRPLIPIHWRILGIKHSISRRRERAQEKGKTHIFSQRIISPSVSEDKEKILGRHFIQESHKINNLQLLYYLTL